MSKKLCEYDRDHSANEWRNCVLSENPLQKVKEFFLQLDFGHDKNMEDAAKSISVLDTLIMLRNE